VTESIRRNNILVFVAEIFASAAWHLISAGSLKVATNTTTPDFPRSDRPSEELLQLAATFAESDHRDIASTLCQRRQRHRRAAAGTGKNTELLTAAADEKVLSGSCERHRESALQ